jgi:hypothetical protein
MVGDSSKEGSYTVNSGGNLRTLNRDKHNETREFWRVAKDFVASNRSVPWFCYVGIHSPHGPYYPLNDHAFDGISLYNAPSRGEEDMGDKPAFLRRLPRPSKEDIKGWRKDYEGKVEELQEVDDLVAEVLGTLAATGQLANTYVLFATDNGYMMGEHRIDAKGAPYEEATRTPFVVRGPGVAQGANRSALVGLIDLPPTLCELAGASTDGFDGRSLVPLLGGGRARHLAQAPLRGALPRPPVPDAALRPVRLRGVPRHELSGALRHVQRPQPAALAAPRRRQAAPDGGLQQQTGAVRCLLGRVLPGGGGLTTDLGLVAPYSPCVLEGPFSEVRMQRPAYQDAQGCPRPSRSRTAPHRRPRRLVVADRHARSWMRSEPDAVCHPPEL